MKRTVLRLELTSWVALHTNLPMAKASLRPSFALLPRPRHGSHLGIGPGNAPPLTDAMTLRSTRPGNRSPGQNGNMYTKNVHIGPEMRAKRGQKEAKNDRFCPVLRFYGDFQRGFHGFLPACSATFSHIAIQTCCLGACRPTNAWACRQTFQLPPDH